jgi:hypothetical protein
MKRLFAIVVIAVSASWAAHPILAQHGHTATGKLGRVSFPISCSRAVQNSFNHAVALLHSFAYAPAEQEFA